MIDWDDIRYFLAVARGGSVRAAAERHFTVLRRIAQLEERLGAQMFEKFPTGYRLTAAGEEVLEFADQMEASSYRLRTRIFGRDQGVRGALRVTLSPTLATHLLMPDFAEFCRLHPEIEMELLSSDEPVNLTNRQADVAIRVVYDRDALPLNLHGLKGPELFGGVYMARELLVAWRAGASDRIRWIVKNNIGISDWAREGDILAAGVPFRTTEAGAQLAAARQGLGMTTFPLGLGIDWRGRILIDATNAHTDATPDQPGRRHQVACGAQRTDVQRDGRRNGAWGSAREIGQQHPDGLDPGLLRQQAPHGHLHLKRRRRREAPGHRADRQPGFRGDRPRIALRRRSDARDRRAALRARPALVRRLR